MSEPRGSSLKAVVLAADFLPGSEPSSDLLREVVRSFPAGAAWVSTAGRRRGRGTPVDPAVLVRHAPTFLFGLSGVGSALWYGHVRRHCRRQPPGLCLVGGRSPATRLALRLKRELGIPYVLHLDDASFGDWRTEGVFPRRGGDLAELSADAAAILVESQVAWLSVYKLGIYPHHLFRVPAGVDLTRFRPGDVPQELAKKLSIGKGPVLLSVVGERTSVDAETMLRAFETVRSQRRDAMLVVVGGKHLQSWRGSARELGVDAGVRIVDSITEAALPEFYRLADLFVLARRADADLDGPDGSNRAYLQALAAGLPIVSTRAPLTDEVAPDGEVGTLVESRAHAKLGRAVLEILRSRSRSSAFSRRARARAEAELDLTKAGQRIGELLHVIYHRQLGGERRTRAQGRTETRRRGRRSRR